MDMAQTGKELVVDEQKTIVAQTAHEELLVAIFKAKLPRITKNYEECLLSLAEKHLDIIQTELETLNTDKRKVLEEIVLERARKGWKKDRIIAKSWFSVSAVCFLASSFLAYLIDPIWLIAVVFSLFFCIPGMIKLDDSENKKFLDAYDKFHGGAEDE